ncbi:glycosyl hydrolase family 61-domain-containing protein [Phakopsora pachyrhizi]|uniref:lytic cellulose monooxygenase (C4-dehydrogenating) n=1 Tax=Phakopsora pachyrhizi TaxID=170000 RepID=A0AAV0B0N9_PHAPC|nr:glycosyl hydrolase family 61-domain-containing protein [Phakopsora pachyrhizi]CAH7675290.1 glycosyl hydrolase family 61-domain-containing protein [Phakopsora pachyrhizi]
MNCFRLLLFTVSIYILYLESVTTHFYIKQWKSSNDNRLRPAQKADLSHSAYRSSSDNIGWIGSKFLTSNHAIVCGASNTPKGKVAPAGGRFFSDASHAAGQTLEVNAGGHITLVITNGGGTGYPHYEGHIQAYLGYCGASPIACQSFDASKAYFFKIQESINGVKRLRRQMSHSLGGDVWEVPIPAGVPRGSYILRFEIITPHESVASEGFQDQYYPSCGQIYVKSNRNSVHLNQLPLLRLPGGYENRNMKASQAPGPRLASFNSLRLRN